MLLEIKNLTVRYGKSTAVRDVSIQVPEGAVMSIIGANGSGKSSLLRAMAGLTAFEKGEIWFQGKRINGMPVNDIVKRGLILVPEGRQLFPYLSVLANLKLGASLRKDKDGIKEDLQALFKLFPKLRDRIKQHAGTLSGGEQQLLAIARGLMAKPKLLCLDEPSLGLAPIIIDQVGEVIKDINKRGVTVLLVEQNVHLALGVASSACALQVGEVVQQGDIETMKSSDIVKKAYLGG